MMYSSLVIQSARPGSSKMFRMFSKKRKKKCCSSILSFRISLVHGYSVFIHIHLLNNYFNWHVCLSVRFFPFVRKLALAPAVLSQILTDKSYLVVKNPQNPQAQNQYQAVVCVSTPRIYPRRGYFLVMYILQGPPYIFWNNFDSPTSLSQLTQRKVTYLFTKPWILTFEK